MRRIIQINKSATYRLVLADMVDLHRLILPIDKRMHLDIWCLRRGLYIDKEDSHLVQERIHMDRTYGKYEQHSPLELSQKITNVILTFKLINYLVLPRRSQCCWFIKKTATWIISTTIQDFYSFAFHFHIGLLP